MACCVLKRWAEDMTQPRQGHEYHLCETCKHEKEIYFNSDTACYHCFESIAEVSTPNKFRKFCMWEPKSEQEVE